MVLAEKNRIRAPCLQFAHTHIFLTHMWNYSSFQEIACCCCPYCCCIGHVVVVPKNSTKRTTGTHMHICCARDTCLLGDTITSNIGPLHMQINHQGGGRSQEGHLYIAKLKRIFVSKYAKYDFQWPFTYWFHLRSLYPF